MKAISSLSDELVCGIDGGGSVSKIVVADLSGNTVFSFQTDSFNHFSVGIDKAKQCFGYIADNLLKEFGCLPSLIYVGNSALSGLADNNQVKILTNGVFQNSKVIFHSDVFVALLGFTMGNAGAVLIAGTGSMACGIDPKGKYHTVGGWGQLLGDEGSGYYIGIEGMKAALRGAEGMTESTLLTRRLIQYLNIKKLDEIFEKVYSPPIEKKIIAAFAVEVEKAALLGDAAAEKILRDAAEWLTRLALVISNLCKTSNLGFYGSVIIHNKLIHSILNENLELNGITFSKPKFPPEIGAVLGAYQEKKITISDSIVENLLQYH